MKERERKRMSIAVVFAARQQNGFNLCVELLEKGYTVYANDHSLWQNAEHERKMAFYREKCKPSLSRWRVGRVISGN